MDAFVVKKSTTVEKKSFSGPCLLPANKRPLAAGAAPAKKKGKPAKIGGMTVEQHRRALGDAVKSKISVEKWAVEAKTHCAITDVDAAVFEALVVPNAAAVTPADFDAASPVVVAAIHGSAAMGEIFGKSKITGGTRCGSWSADRGEIIYFPATREMRVWWTMR